MCLFCNLVNVSRHRIDYTSVHLYIHNYNTCLCIVFVYGWCKVFGYLIMNSLGMLLKFVLKQSGRLLTFGDSPDVIYVTCPADIFRLWPNCQTNESILESILIIAPYILPTPGAKSIPFLKLSACFSLLIYKTILTFSAFSIHYPK